MTFTLFRILVAARKRHDRANSHCDGGHVVTYACQLGKLAWCLDVRAENTEYLSVVPRRHVAGILNSGGFCPETGNE